MTLNKQLQKIVLGEDENRKEITLGIPETENETKIFIEIAEKFAIDFYEWRSTCLVKNIDQYTNKEAMEMFKKQQE